MLIILRVRGASRRDIDYLSIVYRIGYVFWLTSIPREVTAGVFLSRRFNSMRSRVISSRFFLLLVFFFLVMLTACGPSGNTQSTTSTLLQTQTPTVRQDGYGTPIVLPA